MPIRGRKRVRLWPLPIYLNLSKTVGKKTGTSWSTKIGPWSWNSRKRRHRIDLPGALHWEQAPKPRKPRQVRPTVEKYEETRRAELRREPSQTLIPAAGSCSVLASLCTVAVAFGAPFGVALAGVGFGAAAVGCTVAHIRRERAAGRRGLPFLPEPGTGGRPDLPRLDPWAAGSNAALAGHRPTCRAKSEATCRCPGRKRQQRWRPGQVAG